MADPAPLTPAQQLRGLALANETYASQADVRVAHFVKRGEDIPELAEFCALQAAVARDQAADYRTRRDALMEGADAIDALAFVTSPARRFA